MSQTVLDVTPELREKVNFRSDRGSELISETISSHVGDETLAAMEKARRISGAPDLRGYTSLEELREALMAEGPDDEPPLTEEELEDIRIANKELSEGKGIPFSEVLRELW